jgi:hypothetical protein
MSVNGGVELMSNSALVLSRVKMVLDAPHAYKIQTVQSLWSGYGEIARYSLGDNRPPCIVKHINFDVIASHPRGWNTQVSHKRKLSSYYNELAFYSKLASQTDSQCRVPKLFDSGLSDASMWMLMEDLDAAGFGVRHELADIALAKACIKWLANFHACYLEKDITAAWPVGTYWHLKTRQDEFQRMSDSALKKAAHKIDKILNEASYQTLLHGDAKIANFCFSTNGESVAAVDFQYTGKGCGIKDLVYLLGSCLNSHLLEENASALIDYYFARFDQALQNMNCAADFDAIEKQWRLLIPFAWADFERFLRGWSPKHHKLNNYSQAQTELALRSILR